jgi:transcriptional regulator with XRE-family HTH domain
MQKSDHIVLRKIAMRFRELRKERRLTLEAVSFDTGINIARIEAGSKNLAIATIVNLCEYYGVTLEEFFRGMEEQIP